MIKSNLVEILSGLSPKEFKEFGDFVQSPFHNKNEGVIRLYGYLKKLYPDFEEKHIRKEHVHNHVFPGVKYNDAFMRSLIFKLNTLAEEYLSISYLNKNSIAHQLNLLSSLNEKGLDSQLRKNIKQIEARLENVKNKNSEYYHQLFQLESLKNIIYSRTYKPLTIKDKPDENLIAESDNLIKFFLINILRRYRYLFNKEKTVNASFRLDFLEEILEYLSKDGKKFLTIPRIQILYKQILLFLYPDDEKNFSELKRMLMDDNIELDREERRDGLTVIFNYSIEKFYRGNAQYREIMHQIHVYVVEKNLYSMLKGGYFELTMFDNVVTVGLGLKKYEWVLNFIEKYHSKLAPEQRANSYNFSFAKYYFNKGDFEKSLTYLGKVNYTDIYYKFHGRIMMIALNYELKHFDTVLNILESFKKFITNDKLLTEVHKSTGANFIKFVSAILKIKMSNSSDEPELLKKNISECESLAYRVWLLKKTDELRR